LKGHIEELKVSPGKAYILTILVTKEPHPITIVMWAMQLNFRLSHEPVLTSASARLTKNPNILAIS
jgi:hypothetical protein